MKRSRRRPYPDQESVAFGLHQQLEETITDLEHIDRLIPRESSRSSVSMNSKTHANEIAIIEARKDDLLRYIQVVCRDHIAWGRRILNAGWTLEQYNHAKRKKNG